MSSCSRLVNAKFSSSYHFDFSIRSFPLYKGGEKVDTVNGAKTEALSARYSGQWASRYSRSYNYNSRQLEMTSMIILILFSTSSSNQPKSLPLQSQLTAVRSVSDKQTDRAC